MSWLYGSCSPSDNKSLLVALALADNDANIFAIRSTFCGEKAANKAFSS